MENTGLEIDGKGYLLLIRNITWDQGMTPEELQNVLSKFSAWVEGMSKSGKLIDAHPLAQEGKVVSGSRGKVVADGPFAESKEAVGGYFALDVETEEEAVEIAQACPALDYGVTLEVRRIATCCPCHQRLASANLAAAAV
jgi:hypothetical protein